MIVIGYQGIGKSTVAAKDHKYIDLESSCFIVNGKRSEDWHRPYCQMAEHLSSQGYVVFVSSHAAVRETLAKSKEVVIIVYPAAELKDAWIERLWHRWTTYGNPKDYRAYMGARHYYDNNIRDIESSDINCKVKLVGMNYDLGDILEDLED